MYPREFALTSYLVARSLRPGAAINLFATMAPVMFLNVFTDLGQSLLLRRPTPGAITKDCPHAG